MIGIYSILGAFAGYFLTGSIFGGLFGFFIGGFFDNTSYRYKKSVQDGEGYQRGRQGHPGGGFYRPQMTQQDFNLGLVMLTAAVMKADGKVKKSELSFVKQFFLQQFGEYRSKGLILKLRDYLEQDLNVDYVCQQIQQVMPVEVRLQLMHYLFGIAQADGHVSVEEEQVIKNIAAHLGVGGRDYESIKAMFYKDVSSAYRVLGVEQSSTDAEIKKAYRKMAVKYHPDKVSSLGEEHQKAAKEKFQKVQDAYDTIKKERGFA